ncbi:MAG: PH domain-containing protein [Candidatus Anstonellaceae archaeon]
MNQRKKEQAKKYHYIYLSMQKFHPSPLRHYAYGIAAAVFALAIVHVAASASLVPFFPALAALLLFLAAYMALATFRARLTAYTFDGSTLVMERTFISSEKRMIPIKSVDNVHIRISLLGRVLGVSDIYVDTPGGDGYELAMKDIRQPIADALLSEVAGAKGAG